MRDTVYLICKQRGVDRIVKTRMPQLRGGEVAVRLTVEIDDSHFRSPLVNAEVLVGDQFVVTPEVSVWAEEDKEATDE